jgi:hypothetical protein
MYLRTTLLLAVLVLFTGCSPDSAPAPDAAPAPEAGSPDASHAAPAPAPAQEQVFSQEELDQMVAPIALYPDALLAQVLMAATYPGDVSDAVAWSRAHPDASGDDAVRMVADQSWDPSVQSLVAFPQALATLGQDPPWVQRLGDAFLAQPDAVMDSVQRLRRQAQAAGNLESNEYQQVTVLPQPADAPPANATSPPQQAIVIEPAQPDVVYVPSYNPTTIYGTWAYPAYPPMYYPPPAAYYPVGTALASGLAFGVGLAITDALWGNVGWNDWGYHGHVDVHIDVNRYNRINVNNRIGANNSRWQHNPAHRDGVPYRDRASRESYGHGLDGTDRRVEFRGDDARRAQAREQARSSLEKRGIEGPARSNVEARERVREAGRDGSLQRPQTASRSRPGAASQPRQTLGNDHARVAARKQAEPQRQLQQRKDAFRGASHPAVSRAAAQRGTSSYNAARQHASASRPEGRQVSRPSRALQPHGRRGRR